MKNFTSLIVILVSGLMVFSVAFAQNDISNFGGNTNIGPEASPFYGQSSGSNLGQSSGGNNSSGRLDNPLSNTGNIYDFIAKVLEEVAKIGAVICVFFIIYAGFLFVTAQGNEDKLKTAKNAFLYTVIGVIILLGAELIAKIIENTIKSL
ncbi:MAG TPA: pilin [Candidatus Paceibacterota bacterium]|nr:pilin [Candidatus Paceibacterota bacterium]